MANFLIETVIYTIEEVSFMAHMLIKNEDKENRLIIDTYKSLSEDSVHEQKEVCMAFLHTMKNEGAFAKPKTEETSISRKAYTVDDRMIDYHISDYFSFKRKDYILNKDRKDYLVREILGI